ncbi:MAG: beta galactosidase jelly roll domain-containing protein, partial [Vicinamibacterales bacterium]
LHDYALIFVDGKYAGALDRRLGERTIDLPPATSEMPVLDILVEGMGHINFAQEIIDRKGITDRVTLSGMTLTNWNVFPLSLAENWVSRLKPSGHAGTASAEKPGVFFRGTFRLAKTADTFIDMSAYGKGAVWVNGHNLGRFWNIGPQQRLYCPASWLKAGDNEVIVLDLVKTAPQPLRGAASLKDEAGLPAATVRPAVRSVSDPR